MRLEVLGRSWLVCVLVSPLVFSAPGCSSAGGGGSGDGGDGETRTGDGDGDGDNTELDIDDVDTTPDQAICDKKSGDNDGDGFTVEEGDCNDCDENANPGALDVPGNDVDENCDNIPDNQDGCDADLTDFTSRDAFDAAAAVGLCATADSDGRAWGVVSAKYVLADGSEMTKAESHLGHALLTHFGDEVEPREGSRLLSLSTGIANNPSAEDPSWFARSGNRHLTTVTPPDGFPLASDSCPDVVLSDDPKANDSVALELVIRAPTNAKSLSFDFDFYTYEFPDFVCHDYNDNFIVLMDPPPEGALNGNVSFDNKENPISVNSAYLEVCDAEEANLPEYDCPQGPSALEGTGFEVVSEGKLGKGGATGWLTTTVPVEPGSTFTVTFIIWDAGWSEAGMTGDYVNDSGVLVDNFLFSAEPAAGTITRHVAR